MAVEYRLTLAGDVPVARVAERAVPEPSRRPVPTSSGRSLSADLDADYGFDLSVTSGRRGYYDAEGDDGHWEWEPETYVNLGFRLSFDADVRKATSHMLSIVARVLSSGPEDAAFTQNGDRLLLTRFGAVTRKHNRPSWWDHYGFANEIIPN